MSLKQCILIMGVAGSGKTTIAKLLAQEINGNFIDADDLHSAPNIQKMMRGQSLTDADRSPWLEQIAATIQNYNQQPWLVIACSALKNSYREKIRSENFELVYLKGSQSQILERLEKRKNHFMPAALLKSQFDALEEPTDGLTISIAKSPKEIVEIILTELIG